LKFLLLKNILYCIWHIGHLRS